MATLKDVAKLAGVSPATVSRFINGGKVREKHRQNILQAIHDLDYHVHTIARGLKTNRSYTVGYIVPDLSNVFFAHIAKGAQTQFHAAGYSFMVLGTENDPRREREITQFLMDKNIDGIMVSPVSASIGHLEQLGRKNIPLVLVDRMLPDLNVDVVLVDNVNASYDAVEILIKQGHRKIAIINGPQDIFTGRERFKGYLRAFEDYGLEVDREFVRFGDFETTGGYEQMKDLLNLENRPSAVFVTNYYMSLGAIMALNEQGVQIPGELSFVSFDDIELSRIYNPPLTTIVQPMTEIGETASRMLLNRLQEKNSSHPPRVHRLKTKMILGESIKNINSYSWT